MGFQGYKEERRSGPAGGGKILPVLGKTRTVHESANKWIWLDRKRKNIVWLVLGSISKGIVRASELTLSSEDFNDRSGFSGQTCKTEIQSGDFLNWFFFFFWLSCSVKLCRSGFTVRWIKQRARRMKVARLQSKRPWGIMGKALMFQFFKYFLFRWTELFQPVLSTHLNYTFLPNQFFIVTLGSIIKKFDDNRALDVYEVTLLFGRFVAVHMLDTCPVIWHPITS